MFVVIIMFLFLFEPRYPRKTYLASLIPFLTLYFGVNLGILFLLGLEVQGRYTLFTATLPSLLYLLIVAKNRGGRFFFTFCLVDTVMIWVMSLTGILDYFAGNTGLLTFILRMLAFPVMLLVTWRWARRPYVRLLHTVSHGWWLFAAMTGLFYVTLTVMGGIPTNLRSRPEDIPATLMVLVLLPLTYATMFWVLHQQQELFDARERQRTFALQSALMEQRAAEIRSAEEKLRIERHDLRHRFQVVSSMVQTDDKAAVLNYIGAAQEALDKAKVEHWCGNAVLDAILTAYFRRAMEQGIRVEARLAIPDELPVPPAELSTVFANALENMINEVRKLPAPERRMICTCISAPRLMLEFSNPCAEDVAFGPDGLPLTRDDSHGIGTRSIAAFAEKHHAVCSFRMENGWFKLQLAL